MASPSGVGITSLACCAQGTAPSRECSTDAVSAAGGMGLLGGSEGWGHVCTYRLQGHMQAAMSRQPCALVAPLGQWQDWQAHPTEQHRGNPAYGVLLNEHSTPR